MRSEKFPSGGNLVHFWHIKGREDAAYQTEKNSYANVIGHHAGQYVTVRAHNSVHAEALGDASASLLPARAQSALQEKSIRYYWLFSTHSPQAHSELSCSLGSFPRLLL